MEQDIGTSFGAEVRLSLPDSDQRQLFLVQSSSANVNLLTLVHRRGGRVILNGSTNWLIAEFGFREAAELRKAPGIASVGGISLDPERFAAFSKLNSPKIQALRKE